MDNIGEFIILLFAMNFILKDFNLEKTDDKNLIPKLNYTIVDERCLC